MSQIFSGINAGVVSVCGEDVVVELVGLLGAQQSRFTPASMEVVPANEYERFFTVCMILCGMLIFSSFVSAITSAMNQLRNLNSHLAAQFFASARVLRSQGLDPEVGATNRNLFCDATFKKMKSAHR